MDENQITCQSCGSLNQKGHQYCVNCGSALIVPPQGNVGETSAEYEKRTHEVVQQHESEMHRSRWNSFFDWFLCCLCCTNWGDCNPHHAHGCDCGDCNCGDCDCGGCDCDGCDCN